MPISHTARYCWFAIASLGGVARAQVPRDPPDPIDVRGCGTATPTTAAGMLAMHRTGSAEATTRPGTVAAAIARHRAARLASYRAAGIAGGRLALLATSTGTLLGAGGVALVTPAQLAQAPVMFELIGPDGSERYLLRRYQLRGDELVVTTSGEFFGAPGLEHYR